MIPTDAENDAPPALDLPFEGTELATYVAAKL
ncbi:MAG: histidine phosphotransferase ChpT, partial [Brevundimonas sp.]